MGKVIATKLEIMGKKLKHAQKVILANWVEIDRRRTIFSFTVRCRFCEAEAVDTEKFKKKHFKHDNDCVVLIAGQAEAIDWDYSFLLSEEKFWAKTDI